jgi:hypothetical protein
MPTYIKTGYWDKLSKAPKGYLNLDLITGGGGVTSVTKIEFDALVVSNGLTPGAYYLIEGVDAPLYGGTTILIQAATTNTLALAGHGIFYNPKYLNSQDTPNNGYGIWNNYISLTMSDIVGTFNNGDTVTANNGATATYLVDGFLQWISGDWSLATSIDNGAGATADVSGGVSPSYNIGDDAIWGGKHWTNTSGNVGTATNKYTLSSADWTAVAFNSTDYNVVADVIHYDQSHDMIIRRKDKWNNDVDGNFQVFDEFASPDGYDYGNPIKDFQWGNGNEDWNTDDYEYIGVQSNLVKDSYLECINFIGGYLWFNTLTNNSHIYNNTLTNNSRIYNNTLTNNSRIYNNTLTNSNIYSNTLTDSNIENNTLTDSNIENNTLTSSNIENNTLTNSNIYSNTLTSSSIYDNTLTSSDINNNTLTNSNINNNTLTSSINNNTLTNSSINNNTLTDSNIQSNTLINSNIYSNTLTDSSIYNNTINDSTFDFSSSGTLTSKTISNIEANYADSNFDISAATIIFGGYSKQMFRNGAGTTRLGYYNASDVFTVVNVNA